MPTSVRQRDESCVKLNCGWTFYLREGEGDPILILHAAGSSSWMWRAVLDRLAANHNVYVPDLPGFDRSATPDHWFTIEEFTDAMVDFMDKVGLAKATVMGNLTGGMMALDMAVRYPDRVSNLILVSTPCWTPEEGKIVYDRFFHPVYGEDGIPREGALSGGRFGKEFEDYSNCILAKNGRWFSKVHEVNTAFDIPTRIGKVTQPTLAIYGESCQQRRREARLREGLPGVQVAIIPNAESHSYYQDPDRFVVEVERFLDNR